MITAVEFCEPAVYIFGYGQSLPLPVPRTHCEVLSGMRTIQVPWWDRWHFWLSKNRANRACVVQVSGASACASAHQHHTGTREDPKDCVLKKYLLEYLSTYYNRSWILDLRLIERLNLRPGLLALLYGRIHISVKKFCRDPPRPRRARPTCRAPRAAAPGASAPEPWNTVPQVV